MSESVDAWRPLALDELRALFAPLATPWWVAGGLALELFAGRSWRGHGDIDAGVLRRDRDTVLQELGGWLRRDARNGVWLRRSEAEPWAFQILLDDADGSDWLFRRDRKIRLPLSRLVCHAADGTPYLCPEVQLLYKAKDSRARDEADFREIAPLLGTEARDWLRDALRRVAPEHPWLERLS